MGYETGHCCRLRSGSRESRQTWPGQSGSTVLARWLTGMRWPVQDRKNAGWIYAGAGADTASRGAREAGVRVGLIGRTECDGWACQHDQV